MDILANQRLVIIGDSVTDHGKGNPAGEGLFEAIGRGWGGYVSQVDAILSTFYPERAIRVNNKGISGNTVKDLATRWENDVIALRPDWLVVMIGVNDVWRQFDIPRMTEQHILPAEYERVYDELLTRTRPLLKGLVLMTPYYIEPNRSDWMRARMDEYGEIVRKLATKHDARFVDTQAAFDRVCLHMHSSAIAWDRIHPNHIGYMVIARELLAALGFKWPEVS
ncbi:MAG: SGNH/GDSL hydrolase family protein [Verrucomicrobiota bacterium]|nr:SGNH/GDSL hydrolase family protein [Verrucomicrobiota bacterium]